MIQVDGSEGEGGGQVLRTSVGLALVTGTPVRVDRIRARRPKPGLMRQHLTAVRAAASISDAALEGAEPGSTSLTLRPGAVTGGDYRFSVGTAGSATLVLQTVLPALLTAPRPSRLVFEGGTHNPWAPTFECLDLAFLPLLRRMGARVVARLERHGFHPAGGGRFVVEIEPVSRLAPLRLPERGEVRSHVATAIFSALPYDVARRELAALRERFPWDSECFRPLAVKDAAGPGNVVQIAVECAHATEVFVAFGEKGKPAERVAGEAADECAAWLAAGVPVGAHLADQLIVPLALAGGGSFRTVAPTGHTRTQAALTPRFLDVRVDVRRDDDGQYTVAVEK